MWTANNVGTLLTSNRNGFLPGSVLGLDTTAANFSFGTAISGSQGLTKLGPNTLTLSGNDTYTGPTTINMGTLAVAGSSALQNYASPSAITVNAGGTLMLSVSGANGWTAGQLGSLLSANGSGFNPGSILDLDTSGGNFSYGSSIGGSLGLTKTGPNVLTLSTTNGFLGPTTVSAGTLDLANANALQGSTLTTGGITFDTSVASKTFAFGGLSGSGSLSLQNTAGIALTVGGNNISTMYSGALSGSGSLTKTGYGMLTLLGTNTYQGGTTISGGTLVVAGRAVCASYNSASHVIAGSGAMLDLSVGGTGWSGGNVGSLLSANGGGFHAGSTLGLDTTNGNCTVGGFGGSMGLAVFGANALTMTGLSSFSGPTLVSGGTLQLGTGVSGYDGSLPNAGTIIDNGALFYNLATSQTYGGSIGGVGSLTKAGNNSLVLTGSNTYTGPTTISAGTLQLGTGASGYDGSLSPRSTINNSSSLVYNLAGSQTYSGIITGGGNVTKAGSGVLVLTGQNGYWGTTTVSGGTLQLGNGSNSSYDGSLYGTSSITVANTAAMVFDPFGSQTFTGTLSGAGSVTKTGPGTLVLSGVNNAGKTLVSAGTLVATAPASLPTTSSTSRCPWRAARS